jgi:hypothetical protein
MPSTIRAAGLIAALAFAPLAAIPAAHATTYHHNYHHNYYRNFVHIPKQSDSYQNRIGEMDNNSKQSARASAEWVRTHHLPF